MEWINNDHISGYKIIENAVLSEYKQWMKINNCKCKVTLYLYDPLLWITDVTLNNNGDCPFIWKCDEIESLVRITIEVIMANKRADKIKTHKLLSKSSSHQPTWDIIRMTKHEPFITGVYKSAGFDDVFNIMKLVAPDLTEEEIATNQNDKGEYVWDENLVNLRPFDNSEGCIATSAGYNDIENGKSRVKLSLLVSDLLPNMDYIKSMLTPYLATPKYQIRS